MAWPLQAVLGEQVHVVPLVKDLAVDAGVQLAQPPCLAILLGDQLLIQRGDLDVEIVLGQVKVGGKPLNRAAFLVEFDVEGSRLVLPLDLVKVQQSCELALGVVSEVGGFAWGKVLRMGKIFFRDVSVPPPAPVDLSDRLDRCRCCGRFRFLLALFELRDRPLQLLHHRVHGDAEHALALSQQVEDLFG